jgi:beta-1,4-mannosyl-glycoprotein beta-1,4-N-acetylglucosaminyltransferase
MIVDCFAFYNELELLEIRLEELKNVVDWFILVEATQTFSGKPKPCVFEANRHLFERFNVGYIKIANFPPVFPSPWQREEFTRNALLRGIQALNPAPTDVVMLSDVDEIPRADLVASCARSVTAGEIDCFVFHQTLSYYYVNCQTDESWLGTRMARYKDIASLQALRARDGVRVLKGGWHFSFLGGADRIQQKIQAYSHTELDCPEFTNADHIQQCIQQGADLFGREMRFHLVALDQTFPRFLRENQDRFKHLIGQGQPLIATLFEQALAQSSDIQHHLAYLYRLASTVEHITEFGTRSGYSTMAFLYAQPGHLICYSQETSEVLPKLATAAKEAGTDFTFRAEDVLTVDIEPTDLLFIDTWHVEEQMREELRRHANQARRYLVLHDTETFGQKGETAGHRGIWGPVAEFMRQNPHWRLLQHFPQNNGLTVFARI